MQKIITLFICLCVMAATIQAQKLKSGHSLNVQYGFAYASDVSQVNEMNRLFQGIGYQYTAKSNWYVGADVQYNRTTIVNRSFNNFNNGVLYTCGSGYFLASAGMLQDVRILTNDKIYQTPEKERTAIQQSLEASRLNMMMHLGRRWQAGKSQFEAGITFTGSQFTRDIAKNNRQAQVVDCEIISTGQQFKAMFDVSQVNTVKQREFTVGGGLHARYQYKVSSRIGIGIQVITSMNTAGLLAQAAPRVVFNF
jgi:hypothetical protein